MVWRVNVWRDIYAPGAGPDDDATDSLLEATWLFGNRHDAYEFAYDIPGASVEEDHVSWKERSGW